MSSLEDARATLLAALDSLDDAREETGDARAVYLVVGWAHQVKGRTVRGWNATDDPTFVTTGLLREIADCIDESYATCDVDEDDDGD